MSDELTASLKQLLKEVLREVATDLLREVQFPPPPAPPLPVPVVEAPLEEFLLSSRETAQRLAISERHLFELTRTGQMPCVRVGKCLRYSVETIRAWVRRSESVEQRTVTKQREPKPASPSPYRRKPPRTESQKNRSIPPQRNDDSRPPPKTTEEVMPFVRLLREVGIDQSTLPPMTNGDLMRIANVNTVTWHGWQHLGRPLPEEARNKLMDHFRRLVAEQ